MAKTITGYGVDLEPLQAEDLERVRLWRNHPEVARYMVNQDPISAEQQRAWFAKISTDQSCAHYQIYFRNEPVGLIYIYSCDGQPLESSQAIAPGMYLAYDSPYRGTLLAFCPALAMNDYCFEQLGCQKLIAKVQRENKAARRFNEKLGYLETGEQNGYLTLELDYPAHEKAREQLKRFIHFKED